MVGTRATVSQAARQAATWARRFAAWVRRLPTDPLAPTVALCLILLFSLSLRLLPS